MCSNQRCECEHQSHFSLDADTPYHKYGKEVSKLYPIDTLYGLYMVCSKCVEHKHLIKEN